MEAVNDALKYVVQAKRLLEGKTEMWDGDIDEIVQLLDKAEEALVKPK